MKYRKDDEGNHYEVTPDEVAQEAKRLAAIYPEFATQTPAYQRVLAQMVKGFRLHGVKVDENILIQQLITTITISDQSEKPDGSMLLPNVVPGTGTVTHDRVPQGKGPFTVRRFLQQAETPTAEGWQTFKPKPDQRTK